MDRIRRIELYHVSIPLPKVFYPSWIPGYPQTHNRMTLIRVITEDGIEGYSAGPAMGRERAGLGEILGPYLIGEDATDIRLIQQRIREMGYLGWANHWIEPAFWDIKGKRGNMPVYQLLNGKYQLVRLYASAGEVKSPEKQIEEAEKRLEEGFKAIKIRVHDFDEEEDIRRAVMTAEAMRGRMKVAVDANQGWRVTIIADAPLWDLQRAKRFADACYGAGVAWIEEPLPKDSYRDLAELTAYSRVPIAGGELHSAGLAELKMMIENRCYHTFQPDAIFAGGIAQALQVAGLCRQHGLSYTPHTWTNGIGFAVNLQVFLASTFAGEKMLEYPLAEPGWVPEARDAILETPFINENGLLYPPQSAGLGFSINRRNLRRYGKKFFSMGRVKLAFFSIRNHGLRQAVKMNRVKKEKEAKKENL